jgi:hypothetical protein
MMFNKADSNTGIYKIVNGERQTVSVATGSWITDNNFHDIEISKIGRCITVTFDLNTVLSTEDSTCSSGQIGVGSFNDAASFDDVSIIPVDLGKQEQENLTSEKQIPENFVLRQNYPNPFNPSTSIQYQLPVSERVTLKIYNMLGKEIITLVETKKEAGFYEITWNGQDKNGIQVSSGIYIIRFTAGNYTATRKMLFIK